MGSDALMERSNAGLTVQLFYHGDQQLSIRVEDGGEEWTAMIEDSANAMDAFNHPFVYLYKARRDNETENRDIVAAIKEYSDDISVKSE